MPSTFVTQQLGRNDLVLIMKSEFNFWSLFHVPCSSFCCSPSLSGQVVSKTNTHLSSHGLTSSSPHSSLSPLPNFHSSLPASCQNETNYIATRKQITRQLTSAQTVILPFEHNFRRKRCGYMRAHQTLDYFLSNDEPFQVSFGAGQATITNGNIGLSEKERC